MNVEAVFEGGPASGEKRAIPDLMYQINVAYMPTLPVNWWDEEAEVEPWLPYETHVYEPVHATVYYAHRGVK